MSQKLLLTRILDWRSFFPGLKTWNLTSLGTSWAYWNFSVFSSNRFSVCRLRASGQKYSVSDRAVFIPEDSLVFGLWEPLLAPTRFIACESHRFLLTPEASQVCTPGGVADVQAEIYPWKCQRQREEEANWALISVLHGGTTGTVASPGLGLSTERYNTRSNFRWCTENCGNQVIHWLGLGAVRPTAHHDAQVTDLAPCHRARGNWPQCPSQPKLPTV
jgi:hypothetical protein